MKRLQAEGVGSKRKQAETPTKEEGTFYGTRASWETRTHKHSWTRSFSIMAFSLLFGVGRNIASYVETHVKSKWLSIRESDPF